MNPLIQLKKATPLILVALVCFGLLPTTQAVSPAPHGTITTFDPPGSTFTAPIAITPTGVIIGSYVDASGVTHGFLRTPSGSFTTIDVPGSTSTTPTGITPGGVIIGWWSGGGLNLHGFLRALDGSITSFDAPPGGFIGGTFYIPGGPPPSVNPAGDIVSPQLGRSQFLREKTISDRKAPRFTRSR